MTEPSHVDQGSDAAVAPGTSGRLSLLEAALAASADGVILVDAEGRLVFINEAGRRLLGRAPSPGTPLAELTGEYRLRYSDGRPLPLAQTPLARALRGETVTGLVHWLGKADGSEALLSGTANPVLDDEGCLAGALAIFRDDTPGQQAAAEHERLLAELREWAEELALERDRLRAIVASIADEVWFADPEGNVRLLNPEVARGLGFGGLQASRRRLDEISFAIGNPRA